MAGKDTPIIWELCFYLGKENRKGKANFLVLSMSFKLYFLKQIELIRAVKVVYIHVFWYCVQPQ